MVLRSSEERLKCQKRLRQTGLQLQSFAIPVWCLPAELLLASCGRSQQVARDGASRLGFLGTRNLEPDGTFF